MAVPSPPTVEVSRLSGMAAKVGSTEGFGGVPPQLTLEDKMEVNRCHETGVCDHLAKRIGDGGKGFKALHTVSRDSNVTRFLGVAFKLSAKDKGLLLNWCPFCGGQPGYFKRDVPKMTDDELRELWRANGGDIVERPVKTARMRAEQLIPLLRTLMTPNPAFERDSTQAAGPSKQRSACR